MFSYSFVQPHCTRSPELPLRLLNSAAQVFPLSKMMKNLTSMIQGNDEGKRTDSLRHMMCPGQSSWCYTSCIFSIVYLSVLAHVLMGSHPATLLVRREKEENHDYYYDQFHFSLLGSCERLPAASVASPWQVPGLSSALV